MNEKERVGFIGLGSMGGPMAHNLLAGGFRVRGFDIRVEALDALADAGGERAATPAEAARDADLLSIVVLTPAQADAVLFGPDGAVGTMAPGTPVLLHSTVSPAYARDLGERLAGAGFPLLDAPISGGKPGAVAGTLTIMAGGPRDAFERALPAMRAMGGNVYHIGAENGLGCTVKMINQVLVGTHIVAAVEAIALGTRAGVDPNLLFEIISKSAGRSWVFEQRVPRILAGDYEPTSVLDILVKDLGIVLDAAKDMRFPSPLVATAHQQFLAAAAAGHGTKHDAAVLKVYEALSGIDVAQAAAAAADKSSS